MTNETQSTETSASSRISKRFDNMTQVIFHYAGLQPAKPCLRYHRNGAWRDISWGDFGKRVGSIAVGLANLGVSPGDRVAIASHNRPEWALADLGSLGAGAVVAAVYPTLPAEDTAYILNHSRSKVVFAEDPKQAQKILSVRDKLPQLKKIVLMEGVLDHPEVMTLAALEDLAHENQRMEVLQRGKAATHATWLTIIYTSGTTGRPKGAVLTHGNIIRVLESVTRFVQDTQDMEINLSFLPLAHALERVGGHFLPLFLGRTIGYARSLDTIGEDLKQIRPHFALAVPRVFEKIYARIQEQARAKPAPARWLFNWAIGVGTERSHLLERRRPVPLWLEAKYALAQKLVLHKIQQAVGGRLKFFVSGGAPLSAEIARFFHAAGVLVLEGWGATETSAPATLNSPDAFRFGSVGRVIPDVEIKIAEDGELMVRGPNIFKEYLDNPEDTAQALTPDGFHLTGDIGRVDEEGFYYITDRKKELIINSAGKNIAPAKLENLIHERPFISNCITYGDRQKYVVSLITVDRLALQKAHPQLAQTKPEDPALNKLIQDQVDAVNQKLPSFEQIKYFRIVEPDFSPEGGELTPTYKLKRRVIINKHKHLIDSMYSAGEGA